MRPTRAGWMVSTGAALLLVAGRLFGLLELTLLGVAGLAVLGLGSLLVARGAPTLTVTRDISVRRVHAGSDAAVELEVTNAGRRASPLAELRDPVGRGRHARVLVAPLAAGALAHARYSLPTNRRGLLSIGPLDVGTTDPFGLVQRWRPGVALRELTVLPRVERIDPLPHTVSDEPLGGRDRRSRIGTGGGDFHGLREYQAGDDLRRVHWATSLRLDDLMVREDELPWQGRATVLIDNRRTAHDADSFEAAVSAAASIIEACARHRFLVRLISAGGYVSRFGDARPHVDALLEQLAVLDLSAETALAPAIAAMTTAGKGGALAVVIGSVTPMEAPVLERARRRYSASVMVCARDLPSPAPMGPYVECGPQFARSWPRAMASLRIRTPAGAG